MSDAHANIEKLTRMANEIARAFRAQGDKAVAGAAEDIGLYWTRKMRADIFAHLDNGGAGLEPLTVEALKSLRARA